MLQALFLLELIDGLRQGSDLRQDGVQQRTLARGKLARQLGIAVCHRELFLSRLTQLLKDREEEPIITFVGLALVRRQSIAHQLLTNGFAELRGVRSSSTPLEGM